MGSNLAVVFAAPGCVVLKETPTPSPARGELLIRTRRSLSNTGTELTLLAGEFPPDSFRAQFADFPMHTGYSNVGEVVAVGESVGRPGMAGPPSVQPRQPHAPCRRAGSFRALRA